MNYQLSINNQLVKFLHLADIHLGMENYGKVDKKTGLHSRMADFLRAFDFICDFAVKNKVDFVLFAGDAFKTRDPSPTYQREFAKRIKRLAAAKIVVVLLVGNHDLPNAVGKANTLDIYSALEVENVYVARKPEVLEFTKINSHWQLASQPERTGSVTKTYNLKSNTYFQIAVLPWISKIQLLLPEEYEKKEISESYKIMSEKLAGIVEDLAKKTNKNFSCVFLGHATVAGAEFGSEQKAYIGSDVVLRQDVLQKGPWQYVALGHLHKHQILSQTPSIIYSGSIERVDFGEEKEKKGFLICELGTNRKTNLCKFKFIPLPTRKFLTIFCEINENDDPTNKILKEIKKTKTKDAVVKIKVKIPESKQSSLQEKEILKTLSDVYYFAGIQKEIIRRERQKTDENIESLSILEALDKYWQSRGVAEKRIGELKQYTQKLLEE
jgi:exonuclease SbcD